MTYVLRRSRCGTPLSLSVRVVCAAEKKLADTDALSESVAASFEARHSHRLRYAPPGSRLRLPRRRAVGAIAVGENGVPCSACPIVTYWN